MLYSQFSIDVIKTSFGVTISEKVGIFAELPEIEPSKLLQETLQFNIPIALAINSEKSRSEMIISPILIELKKRFPDRISLFSGKEFNVDPEKGLIGFCDFLISRSSEQLFIEAPVIIIVEAKNDNIEVGLGQCMAEMVASQLFNQRRGNEIHQIYGVVTNGSNWKFMRLEGQVFEIDLNEYFVDRVGKILSILSSGIES
ncbi:MAG: hypothetical protein WBF52_13180 [Geitlerinemataceae cyanobacterium]